MADLAPHRMRRVRYGFSALGLDGGLIAGQKDSWRCVFDEARTVLCHQTDSGLVALDAGTLGTL
ncbi:hypothetical protein [Actinomadura sp. NTSP31]|uniref:hypothetical protein n=1 Tax=Actinomadura sp. NTSP31 TaxID=1735447 RepID=UPI0035C17B82